MRNRSFLDKLRDVIMGPPLPVRHQGRIVIPFYLRLWQFIRPPKPAANQAAGLNRSQRRIVQVTLSVVVLSLAGWALYAYLYSGRQEESAASLQQGLTSVAKGDYMRSVELFTEAISLWPANAVAYLNRGNSQEVLGRPAAAKQDWDKATELNPDLADAYTARGTQYRLQGKTELALQELSRSIQLHPTVDGYYQRGQIYNTLKDYARAIEDYDRSIAERRDAPYVYRARSLARRAIGDLTGAAEDRAIADRIEGLRPVP